MSPNIDITLRVRTGARWSPWHRSRENWRDGGVRRLVIDRLRPRSFGAALPLVKRWILRKHSVFVGIRCVPMSTIDGGQNVPRAMPARASAGPCGGAGCCPLGEQASRKPTSSVGWVSFGRGGRRWPGGATRRRRRSRPRAWAGRPGRPAPAGATRSPRRTPARVAVL